MQTLSDEQHQALYTESIRDAQEQGADEFQNWFNRAENVTESLVRGYWDFSQHILTPKVCEYINKPEEQIALEIGYGGGRILNAACSFFQHGIGVDVHGEQSTVEDFLRAQHKTNFTLMRTDGRSLDVDAESVDFVYSFIVLQHLPTFEVLTSYINETYRCLRKGGIAQLYFGKYNKLHPARRVQSIFAGYREITNAPVNFTSLVVRVGRMKQLCRSAGFRVVDSGPSYKTMPSGYPHARGGQNYVTLVK